MTTGAGIRARLERAYLTADPRSLGLARIALGLLLLADLWRHADELRYFYADGGLLPLDALPPWYAGGFTILRWFHTPAEVAAVMAVSAVFYLGFLLGYRTRLFQLLSLFVLNSFHHRVLPIQNGGDRVLELYLFWLLFLPVDLRFSVDAVRGSLRARVETTTAELQERKAFAPEAAVVSPAVTVLLLQVGVIYFFSGVYKDGIEWKTGSVVYYILRHENMVTWLGYVIRDAVPMWLSSVLTFATLYIEIAAPFLILLPVGNAAGRLVAFTLLASMHLGFALFMKIGVFPYVMVALYIPLFPSEFWRPFVRRAEARGDRRVAYWDGARRSFGLLRLLSRLDPFERIRFARREDPIPPEVESLLAGSAVVAEDPATGIRWTGARALLAFAEVIPFGVWAVAPLRLEPVRRLCDPILSRYFGSHGAPRPLAIATEHPVADRFERWARAVALVLAAMLAASEVVVDNAELLGLPRLTRPRAVVVAAAVLSFREQWRLFAPSPPRSNRMLVVDATTVSGAHIDPYNMIATRPLQLPLEGIPPRLDPSSPFWGYSKTIANNDANQRALAKWVLDHHVRTGRPDERVVSFIAYDARQMIPSPRQTRPGRLFLFPLIWHGVPPAQEEELERQRDAAPPGG